MARVRFHFYVVKSIVKLGHLVHKTNFVKTDVPTTVFRLVISADDMSGLEYLKKFVAWIEKWKKWVIRNIHWWKCYSGCLIFGQTSVSSDQLPFPSPLS